MKKSLKTGYLFPIDASLKKMHNAFYKKVLDCENVANDPELEMLCDLLLLIRCGALECYYCDALPDESGEGIFLRLRTD